MSFVCYAGPEQFIFYERNSRSRESREFDPKLEEPGNLENPKPG
jgi:hypothetical protein